jgi:hypothetical protein
LGIAPVERPVASATCGFVRFIGGGPVPYAAARLVEHTNVHVPFLIGTAMIEASCSVGSGSWRRRSRWWCRGGIAGSCRLGQRFERAMIAAGRRVSM